MFISRQPTGTQVREGIETRILGRIKELSDRLDRYGTTPAQIVLWERDYQRLVEAKYIFATCMGD